MQKTSGKKSILHKTAQIAGSSIASKFLAVIRSVLEVRYIGTGAVADAFWTAYKIPNMLRKVFAEGALSAAFIPSLVTIVRKGEHDQANRLMTITLVIIEAVVLALCLLVFIFPQYVILWTAPGFAAKPVELATTVPLVRVLVFFIFFISSSALLAGAMQAKNHFFVPSWGPVLLNIVYITGILLGLYIKLPIIYFAYFIIGGGALLLLLHVYMYFRLGFSFALPDSTTWRNFRAIMLKFLPCVIAMSPFEISSLIDNMLASYLPTGSIALLSYAMGFFRIPLSTFAIAFSTVLLSHLSHVSTYAPKRLAFYLVESTKLILWVTVPATLLMSFFAYHFFYTIFLSEHFTLIQVKQASLILIALLPGLFFFSINKVLLSIYYSLHSTLLPTIITVIGAICNTLLNLVLMRRFGVVGLAIATTVGAMVQTVLFFFILHKYFGYRLYIEHIMGFASRFFIQLSLYSAFFYGLYEVCNYALLKLPEPYAHFMLHGLGYWLWTGPLALGLFGVLYLSRKMANLKLYFLD